ncbi:MAG: hypothetical protein EPO22_01915 [Dehalococcoidia bacterium]|nr:MAG: hypothetical protein EPO22_01915 [Dehalococcoidia bacterium]
MVQERAAPDAMSLFAPEMAENPKVEEERRLASREEIDERNRQFLVAAERDGIRLAAVMIEEDACSACRVLILAYEFRDLPALPLQACRRLGGRLCWYVPLPDR